MQDFDGCQDDHTEEDVEESQRGSGPFEPELLDRKDTDKANRQFVYRYLTAMTARFRI